MEPTPGSEQARRSGALPRAAVLRRRQLLGTSIAATIATACGAAGGAGGTTASGPAAGTPAAGAGNGTARIITFAVVGPMTGDYAIYGTQFVQGVRVLVDQVNGTGGIAAGPMKGAKLDVKKFDDQLDPKQAASIATKIVQDTSVWAAIGAADSDTAQAAGPIFDRAGIAFFAWGSAPSVVESKKTVFIDSPPHAAYAYAPADFMKQAGYKNVAVLKIAGAFGTSIEKLFRQGAQARGLTVPPFQEFNFGEKEFKPLLLKAREANPDVLAPIGFASETALIVKQAREIGWNVPIVDVGGGGYDPSFLATAGAAAEGFTGNAPFDPDRKTAAALALREAFKKTFGSDEIPPAAPNQYEAALAAVRAIEMGATKPADVPALVHKVAIPDTGISALSWDETGTPIGRPMYIYKVQGGKFVFQYGYVYDGKDVKRIELQH